MTGRCARSLMGLSEKSGTRTRVSPSLGITKERVQFISDFPLSSLYSCKIPGVLVLCSNPFSNLASIIYLFSSRFHFYVITQEKISISFNKVNISNYKSSGVIV